ncbi:MAG: hypothetical protein KC457_29785, partial [Myxococcales bacterium]|nr:hypothetical protein [Myxococcales bacterium]
LDLGIAAARTAPGDALAGLRGDFNRINEVLASLLGQVKRELSEVWPPLAGLARISGGIEDGVINFSMTAARDDAWKFAQRLAPQAVADQGDEIERRDRWVAAFADKVISPALQVRLGLLLIRLGERRSVPEVIDILM